MQHGFPYLSGAGRRVIKDVALLPGAWLIIVDTARALLRSRTTDAISKHPPALSVAA
jgi:reactive chlorine resistance protein C